MARRLLVLMGALLAAGCGGGGGGGGGGIDPADIAPGTSAEGRWVGKAENNLRNMNGVVLDDGSYWLLYTRLNNANVVGGVLQGTGVSNLGDFTSADGRDFNMDGLAFNIITIDGNYLNKKRLTGVFEYPSNNARKDFALTYDAAHDQTPTAAAIVGSYAGVAETFADGVQEGVTTSAALTVSVPASGNAAPLDGSNGACSFTGTATPRAKGNAYSVALDVTGSGCTLEGTSVTGVAFFDAAAKRLHVVTVNGARTDGLVFIGTKP